MEHFNFQGWAPHYIENVCAAADAWMRSNPHMEQTAVYAQMRDIRDEARKQRRDVIFRNPFRIEGCSPIL